MGGGLIPLITIDQYDEPVDIVVVLARKARRAVGLGDVSIPGQAHRSVARAWADWPVVVRSGVGARSCGANHPLLRLAFSS